MYRLSLLFLLLLFALLFSSLCTVQLCYAEILPVQIGSGSLTFWELENADPVVRSHPLCIFSATKRSAEGGPKPNTKPSFSKSTRLVLVSMCGVNKYRPGGEVPYIKTLYAAEAARSSRVRVLGLLEADFAF
ncbi:hypothetical protein C8R43DRAFT_959502 [Mycena crocata]|nr:hypothetical protein C8R43DRAFT_959502 [Mycena crocata]